MKKEGYIHIYYGTGKGKTSALNGMAIRALGNDWKVKYLRFLKNRITGELTYFTKHQDPNFTVKSFYSSSQKFIWEMNDQEREVFKKEMLLGIEELKADLQDSTIDLLICDELLDCVINKFITEEELIEIIKTKNPHTELAISGHYISDAWIAIADLVSEVKPIKHYFDQGVMARKGIEW
ncbi:cobalamin adenosyltransferase [Williamsoniiplasma somnilux]|uniref:Cobalamin adenosyltransferase n=1 Tax=Williamsoniiplasma somnilux TaxID=215578 RepID=A0A2K8NYZ6_9MOLU|nr:cob(I)yrinic acid a,c-diamide adenosyltransferase [Williamsoniiplasma somnilux]ATZ18438.1 cobalamin adenosyltransferase [Williamsoniiplasma somnilux]